MLKMWIPTVMALAFSHNAFAGEGDISPVKIERFAIIATATGGHLAGNMEIKILGGFKLPVGVFCDTNYITTKKTTDPDYVTDSSDHDTSAEGQAADNR